MASNNPYTNPAAASGRLPPRRLCIAPMMERTDRHFRYLMRLIAPNAWLYTEMITTNALLHGNAKRHLLFDETEHPVALQLGGSEPAALARAARLGENEGYDEINLNVGCPSGRVQQAEFGAALMRDSRRVADCVAAMGETVQLPVTVKTRLGIDDLDSYDFLHEFVSTVREGGCRTFIVHARKAWLKGLSPKENREIPPLDYARVHRLKADFPELEIIINGGLTDAQSLEQLDGLDGVMLGRAAYKTPMLIGELDRAIFGQAQQPRPGDAESVLNGFLSHVESELSRGTALKFMCRHLMGLHAGSSGARRWRRLLGELPDGERGLLALKRQLGRSGPTVVNCSQHDAVPAFDPAH